MASCLRPNTATTDDDSSDSSDSLTPPPDSPSVAALNNTITVDATLKGKLSRQVKSIEVNGDYSANGTANNEEPASLIRPYVNLDSEFTYYDKVDDREASIATGRNSEEPEDSKTTADLISEVPNEDAKTRYRFPKFTPLEVFEDYLANPEELTYEDLYDRASKVTPVLVEYQREMDNIQKEIDAHEAYVKAQGKIAADKSKASEEEKTKVDDERYLQIAQEYKTQLKLSRSDWEKWLEKQQGLYPDQSELHEYLRNLRNPTFLSGVLKRQKVSQADTLKLANKPIIQERITKEEIAVEKRKRYGRLLDQTTFDDMKHADAYGFNYSSQPHHVGNQPQPFLNEKAKVRGATSDEGRGGRSQRTAAKRSYDADRSVTPESDEDELPAKRARKARNLDAGLDLQTRPRTSPQSRGATPPVRTFPSGKRVGRPPTKSKLKDFQVPPPSTSPTLENGTAPRKLAPKQEEALHESVENLVNQTQPRRNHGKSVRDEDDLTKSTTAATSRPSTSSSHEPRKRKPQLESNNTEPETLVVEPPQTHTASSSLPPPVAIKNRKRKVKEEDIDESLLSPEDLEALRKKRIKSQKLSESLRKRWEKGEMATAMESRKATNAKKKAAKLEAKQTGDPGTSYQQPFQMVPAIVPNQYPTHETHGQGLPPMQEQYQLQSHSQVPAPASATMPPQQETPTPAPFPPPKRKYNMTGRKASAKAKKAAPPLPLAAPLPPVRGPSKRAKKPSRLLIDANGLNDDDDDEDEEVQNQVRRETEYDRYQFLQSPENGEMLGKRNRKTRMDLSHAVASDDGEDDDGYSSS